MQRVMVSNLENILIPRIGDVGYDLVANSPPKIVGTPISEFSPYYSSIDYIEYVIDLKIAPPADHFSMIFPRSSLSKYRLSLCNSVGVIDNSYRGNIIVRFNYLSAPEDLKVFPAFHSFFPESAIATEVNMDKIYKQGDKIAQLLFFPSTCLPLEMGELSETERGAGGFGSTGA